MFIPFQTKFRPGALVSAVGGVRVDVLIAGIRMQGWEDHRT
jgi:hypothetical protein